MADGYANAVQAGLRAALVADAGVAALVDDRVVDKPGPDIVFPYVRFGRITPTPRDTDGARGARVLVGLECHSRPLGGRVEAQAICAALWDALHRRPEVLTVAGFAVVEALCLTSAVDPGSDGASYIGTLAVQVDLFG